MLDAIVIGRGPAGIQAAIYLARARRNFLVIGHGRGSLEKAESVGNYYGLSSPVSGASLLDSADDQAHALGIKIEEAQVVGLAYAEEKAAAASTESSVGAATGSAVNFAVGSAVNSAKITGGFAALTPGARFEARALIIATGAARAAAPTPGLSEFEGKGVSYCATCDGFFYGGKPVGVLGASEYALREASELEAAGAIVTIFTDGAPEDAVLGSGTGANPGASGGKTGGQTGGNSDGAPRFNVVRERVIAAVSEREVSASSGVADRFGGLRTADGRVRALSGLFVAVGIADSGALARILGVATTRDGSIITDRSQATNVPGVFAAGDCTGVFRQAAVAAGQGAVAARGVLEYLGR